jgi:hypothetical protein
MVSKRDDFQYKAEPKETKMYEHDHGSPKKKSKKKKKKKATTRRMPKVTINVFSKDLKTMAMATSVYNGIGIIVLVIVMATRDWLREENSGCYYGLYDYNCPKYNRSGSLTGDCKEAANWVLFLLSMAFIGFVLALYVTLGVVFGCGAGGAGGVTRSGALAGFLGSFAGWLCVMAGWIVYVAIASSDCLRAYARERGVADRDESWSFVFCVVLWLYATPLPTFFMQLLRNDGKMKSRSRKKKKGKNELTADAIDEELGLGSSAAVGSPVSRADFIASDDESGKSRGKTKRSRRTKKGETGLMDLS